MIIDTHCHYNLSPLYEGWSDQWQAAQEKGVVGSIVVGTSIETSQRAIEISQTQAALLASVGVHPLDWQQLLSVSDILDKLRNMIDQEKVIAIGECGLDYFRLGDGEQLEISKSWQKEILLGQLELARDANLPLIIHLRDKKEEAYWDFLQLFKSVFKHHPFILHCVSGPLTFVTECISLGAYIGVAGNVTYPNSNHIRALVGAVPRERILAETDAPFLPPQEARGKTCEPWMIQWTVEYLKQHYGLQYQELITNTSSLFPQFEKSL